MLAWVGIGEQRLLGEPDFFKATPFFGELLRGRSCENYIEVTLQETDLAGTVAIPPSKSVYVKLSGDPGWRITAWGWLPRGLEPEYLLPGPVGDLNAGGDLEARPTPAEGVMGWFSGLGREGVGDTAYAPPGFESETTANEIARESEKGACMQLEVCNSARHPRGTSNRHSPFRRRCRSATIWTTRALKLPRWCSTCCTIACRCPPLSLSVRYPPQTSPPSQRTLRSA